MLHLNMCTEICVEKTLPKKIQMNIIWLNSLFRQFAERGEKNQHQILKPERICIKCNSMFKIRKLTAHDVRHEKWKLKRKQMLPIMCVKWYMHMGLWWNCKQKIHWLCNSVNAIISMNLFFTLQVDNVSVAT